MVNSHWFPVSVVEHSGQFLCMNVSYCGCVKCKSRSGDTLSCQNDFNDFSQSSRGQFRVRLRLKCDGTRAETRFRLSPKRTSTFKPAGASVQLTTGSRGLHIGGINAGYTMFRGSVKGTGYPPHLPVSPSLPLPCLTVCHHISIGLYFMKLGHTDFFRSFLKSLCSNSASIRRYIILDTDSVVK